MSDRHWNSERQEWVYPLTDLERELLETLRGAVHALRSYQYGNASTELAESVADACEAAITKAEGRAPNYPPFIPQDGNEP